MSHVVQGMNFIAGCLLLFMDEEDTFWCLAIIVEELLPGYYSMAMVEPQVPCPTPACRVAPDSVHIYSAGDMYTMDACVADKGHATLHFGETFIFSDDGCLALDSSLFCC